MRPLIFAAGDEVYYNRFGKALKKSAMAQGMSCEIVNGGEMDRGRAMALRYILLPEMLERHPAILVLDIDSIVNDIIDIPDRFDAGVFLRQTDDHRKRVMGSAFYITDRAMEFAVELRRRLLDNPKWYDDQYHMFKLYERYKDKYKFKIFGTNFINWHGVPGPIWTGKGLVKNHDKFKERLAQFT